MRPLSKVAPDWWDYTTLDRALLDEAAQLGADDLLGLPRPGFRVVFYDTLEDFYLAEALEYINAWRQATARMRRPVFAGRSAPPSSFRWWPGWLTSWRSTCATLISGAWMNGWWMGVRRPSNIR